MTIPLSQFDGPRLVRGEELIASKELSILCFDGPEISSADEAAAASYTPPRRGGTYVMALQGKPVSQIDITHDRVRMYDGLVRTASIGGVCTHPDYRGLGLASLLLEYCTRKAVEEGASLMLISGTRDLYTRAGSVPHGRLLYFSIQPIQGPAMPTPPGLAARRMTRLDALTASRLYAAEPVHYLRSLSVFSERLDDMEDPYLSAEKWMVERSGQAAAYLLLGCPYELQPEEGFRYVSEYAGSRLALVEGLEEILVESKVQSLRWPVPWQDTELIHLLQERGYSASVEPLEGHTWRIVNFPALMKGLRPMLRAQLDRKVQSSLLFEQGGPVSGGSREERGGKYRLAIALGAGRLELDGAAMTRLVMGSAESEIEPVSIPEELREVVPALFPLPSFLPGWNYR